MARIEDVVAQLAGVGASVNVSAVVYDVDVFEALARLAGKAPTSHESADGWRYRSVTVTVANGSATILSPTVARKSVGQ
jgi:hypothetical protein